MTIGKGLHEMEFEHFMNEHGIYVAGDESIYCQMALNVDEWA